jgi:hypothetical protein
VDGEAGELGQDGVLVHRHPAAAGVDVEQCERGGGS